MSNKMHTAIEANDFFQVKKEDYDFVIAKCGVKDKMVKDSIANIRDWYRMQLHLPEGAISDQRIFRLLLGTNFSLEKTKQKIDNILTVPNVMPEIMIDRDPCSIRIKNTREYIDLAIIPQRLDDFTRINILTPKGVDFSKYVFFDCFKFCAMAHDYITCFDLCLGDHYIVDWKGTKLSHIMGVAPTAINKFMFLMHECYGTKVKSVHYVNVPSFAEIAVKIFKAGFSEKIGNRVHLHRDYEGLSNFFPKSHLPFDLGGENKSTQTLADELVVQMVKRREWYLQHDQCKVDESKRVGTGNAMSKELQGMDGSFRTIDID